MDHTWLLLWKISIFVLSHTSAISSDTFFLQTLTKQIDTEVTIIAFWKC
jgi:hypothetical protein